MLRAFGATRTGLLVGFGVLHFAYLGYLLPTILAGETEGDLPLYREWAEAAMHGHAPLLHGDWVYPAGALGPIVLADVLGPNLYQLLWLLITAAGNLFAIWVLTRGFRNRAGMLASLHEPRFTDLWLTRVRTCPRVRNHALWRCNSYRA